MTDDPDSDPLVCFVADPAAESVFDERVRSHAILLALQKLSDRERRVIVLRFYYDLSLEQTGKEMGLSKNTVHQLERKALRKFRFNAQQLIDFL